MILGRLMGPACFRCPQIDPSSVEVGGARSCYPVDHSPRGDLRHVIVVGGYKEKAVHRLLLDRRVHLAHPRYHY